MTWTSLLPAWARARETELFDDPYAEKFLAAYAGEFGPMPDLGREPSPLWDAVFHGVVTRTAYFDAVLRRRAAPQVVVLGAGLETRAYRLGLGPGVTVFELDRAETLGFKERVLAGEQPTARRVPVVAELGVDELAAVLTEAGFDPGLPTAWLAEGFLFYLTRPGADALLDDLAGLSAEGSVFLGEVFRRPYRDDDLPVGELSGEDAATWLRFVAAFRTTPAIDDPGAWLRGHGWTPAEVTDQVAVGRAYGREAPDLYHRARDWIFYSERSR